MIFLWKKGDSNKYIEQIKEVDYKIKNIVDNKKRDRLIFADKMPMQYFIDYYNLKVSAAFDGCSTETEPTAKTIAYLQKLVKDENIPVVLYIELNYYDLIFLTLKVFVLIFLFVITIPFY